MPVPVPVPALWRTLSPSGGAAAAWNRPHSGVGMGLTAFHVMTSSNEYDSVSSVAGKGDIQHCVYTVGGQS